MNSIKRRDFVKKSAFTTMGIGLAIPSIKEKKMKNKVEPLFKISLAEWSLERMLKKGRMDNLDFAIDARKHGIDAVEYVNQFFMDKAKDKAYLREMKTRADGEGVRSLLIMCDNEGSLGDPDPGAQMKTVDNHKKWVEAAKYLGCHSIRVNGYTKPWSEDKNDYKETIKLVSSGLRQLCQFADDFDINVIIENHGGWSSNAQWLVTVIKEANHPRAGTLPDFGNFQISATGSKVVSYDSYRGTRELMPFAKGVSVKPSVWNDKGQSSDLDYKKMMAVVLDAGYRGYCGIEHGEEGKEWEAILSVKNKLEIARDQLAGMYSG